MHFTRPGESKTYKSSCLNLLGADGYFLFFKFRIATINNVMFMIIINSSYVLISIILSVRLGSDESTSSNHPGKYIVSIFIFYLNSGYLHPSSGNTRFAISTATRDRASPFSPSCTRTSRIVLIALSTLYRFMK